MIQNHIWEKNSSGGRQCGGPRTYGGDVWFRVVRDMGWIELFHFEGPLRGLERTVEEVLQRSDAGANVG